MMDSKFDTKFAVGPAFEELTTDEMMASQGGFGLATPTTTLTLASSIACGIGSFLATVVISATVLITAGKL